MRSSAKRKNPTLNRPFKVGELLEKGLHFLKKLDRKLRHQLRHRVHVFQGMVAPEFV